MERHPEENKVKLSECLFSTFLAPKMFVQVSLKYTLTLSGGSVQLHVNANDLLTFKLSIRAEKKGHLSWLLVPNGSVSVLHQAQGL